MGDVITTPSRTDKQMCNISVGAGNTTLTALHSTNTIFLWVTDTQSDLQLVAVEKHELRATPGTDHIQQSGGLGHSGTVFLHYV
jgi:hypothetical protein